MKVLAIGDIHGGSIWRTVIEREFENVDKVVFIGDYWDTHLGFTFQEQRKEFLDICKLKEDNPKKVTLLFGNHDLHYIINQSYSGYQYEVAGSIKKIIDDKLHLLQAAVEFDKVLYSHAGVTETWQDTYLSYTVESINSLFKKRPGVFGFSGQNILSPSFRLPNPYGDDIWQSPMWVRPDSLKYDRGSMQYDEIYKPKQVVGHTYNDKIKVEGDFAFIDALPHEYLIVDDGNFEVKKV